jgi:hypothetical protein
MKYPGTLDRFTARGNDQQTIVHDATDRTDFLTGLGQEVLPQRWCSAKSSNNPISFPGAKKGTGAFYGRKAEAKRASNRRRRQEGTSTINAEIRNNRRGN